MFIMTQVKNNVESYMLTLQAVSNKIFKYHHNKWISTQAHDQMFGLHQMFVIT